jgi:demethylmenaquinone methyltransferase/2-methoxy-6-polyprenyl-1,4-benzoquinol methylase
MEDYYARRATEYDASVSYQRPKFAASFCSMKAQLQIAMYGRDALEIACGTGEWTAAAAQTARSVVATDVNEEVLAVARRKVSMLSNVQLRAADAYTLEGISPSFTAAFAAYWWSHMPIARIGEFLAALHRRLMPGSTVLFLDDLPDDSRKTRAGQSGDLLRQRRLRSGAEYEVIKNYPTQEQLMNALRTIAEDVVYARHVIGGCDYWIVTYKTKS